MLDNNVISTNNLLPLSSLQVPDLSNFLEIPYFPFSGKKISTTSESESFKNIDIAKEVEIPLPPHPGAFGVTRKYHTHEGVDLYCLENEPVYAIQSGVVVAILKFTGPHAGTPWWNNTYAVAIESEAGIINYGELRPNDCLKLGSRVNRGELVGNIITVLSKDKGRPRNMLHLELYEPGSILSQGWDVGAPKPQGLLDPSNLLLKSAGLI